MEKCKLHNPADDDNKNRKSDSEDVSDAAVNMKREL